MAETYEVTEIKDGKAVTTVHEMSPDMQAAIKKMREWDGWCRCDNPETGEIEHRGHSVDVYCRCGGVLQVG